MRLPAACKAEILSHAESTYPDECCGILLGKDGTVSEARRATNLNTLRARDRYQLDPRDQLLAEKDARIEGLEILGFYHSHPDHPALPSHTDQELAWAEYVYVIVSVTNGKAGDMSAFRGKPQLSPVFLEVIP